MKGRFILTIVSALCVVSLLAGCGDNGKGSNEASGEKVAIDEVKEEKPKDTVKNSDVEISDKDASILSFDMMDEIKNGNPTDFKVQVCDMIFTTDLTMTKDDVKAVLDASSVEWVYEEKASGDFFVINDVKSADGTYSFSFEWYMTKKAKGSKKEILGDDACYLSRVMVDNVVDENGEEVSYAYQTDVDKLYEIASRDELLTYLSNNNYHEVDKLDNEHSRYIRYQYNDGEKVPRKEDVDTYERYKDVLDDTVFGLYTVNGETKITVDIYTTLRSDMNVTESWSGGDLEEVLGRLYAKVTYKYSFNADGTVKSLSVETMDGSRNDKKCVDSLYAVFELYQYDD